MHIYLESQHWDILMCITLFHNIVHHTVYNKLWFAKYSKEYNIAEEQATEEW